MDFFNKANSNENIENYSKILRLSLKANDESIKSFNNVQFSFDVNLNYFLVCDMHLIYLFERVFYQVIKDYEPDIFLIYVPSSFRNYKNTDGKVLLTGDGNDF